MNEVTTNENLISFWNSAYEMSDEEKKEALKVDPESWKTDVTSQKLFDAANSLSSCKKVLDYGCGDAWGSVIAAKGGCPDITAVDVAKNIAEAAALSVKVYGVENQVKTACVPTDYLHTVEENTFDGIFCSNVLDVLPPKTTDDIIEQMARVAMDGAKVVIGMNYHISREDAAKMGEELDEEGLMYVNGVLRLVPRTDEEWSDIFSKFFTVDKIEHFAWPGETKERRRIFYLIKK